MSKKIFQSIKDIKLKNSKNPIGTGAFSEVRLIYHSSNPQKYYAMKTLQKINKTEEKYIKQEITLHKSLNHKNIIKYQNSFENTNNVFIILEYAEKGDLYDFLSKKKFSSKKKKKNFYKKFFMKFV